MQRLVCAAAIFGVSLASGSALADGDAPPPEGSSVVAIADPYQPGKYEVGAFMGGFISNFFHQFYDDSLYPPTYQKTGNRETFDRVNPEVGTRFAIFPHPNFGIEAEASAIFAHTSATTQGAQIYGLGLQAVLQRPGRFTPYVALGASVRYEWSPPGVLGSDADFPIHASGGVKFWVSRDFAIRADLRYMRGPSQGYGMDPHYTLNAGYGEFSLGVQFNPRLDEKP